VVVRVDDGVAYYRHTADPIRPKELARRMRHLDRMLLLPPSTWTPTHRERRGAVAFVYGHLDR
jgi:hypothetical protein